MKAALLLPVFIFSICIAFAQDGADANKHTNLHEYLIQLEQVSGRDSILYTDSVFSYQIIIPKWWHILEAPSRGAFGGLFPAVDAIENAMIIKSYAKNEYKDFSQFEDWLIKQVSIGEKPGYGENQRPLLKKELNDFSNIGKAYKVQLIHQGLIYHCCYVLVETKSAYIWIDFTATPTTYDKNFPKFAELMSLFSKIE